MRHFSSLDVLLNQADSFLTTIWGKPIGTSEPNPSHKIKETNLTEAEKKESIALMRVNHTGEVCAQALYQSQSLYSGSAQIHQALLNASIEENNHLIWCQKRLEELGGKVSYLNPIFYSYSFLIGVIAGSFGDSYSLGFVVETEKQVENHLNQYIQKLPLKDKKSEAILKKMREDEIHHGKQATDYGATQLPKPIKKIMNFTSKVMTKTTYYI